MSILQTILSTINNNFVTNFVKAQYYTHIYPHVKDMDWCVMVYGYDGVILRELIEEQKKKKALKEQ